MGAGTMSGRIDMFHGEDVDGHVVYRAKGIARFNPQDLAAALGVEEHQLVLRLDDNQVKQLERQRKRRPRKSADEAFWSHYHGHE